MAGTTTTSFDNLGLANGAKRETTLQLNAALDDIATAAIPLSVQSTAVGNVNAGEDTLQTYSLPASTLNANACAIRIRAWGTVANNANAKTLKLYFGATTIISQSMTTSAALNWDINAIVIRTATDTQDLIGTILESSAALAASKQATEIGTAAIDDGAAITIKCTGEATTTNDIVQEGFVIELLPTASNLTAAKVGNLAGTAITTNVY